MQNMKYEVLLKMMPGKTKAEEVKKEGDGYPCRREKTVPPHVAVCRVCGGKGKVDGCGCKQCKGSGRVIVSSEVVTYITAYDPEAETGKEGNDAV